MCAKRLCQVAVFCAAFGLSSGLLSAASFSFQGAFVQDDEMRIFSFVTSSPTATVQTFGYGGGTDAAGDVIAPGGFAPVISVFDDQGGLVASSNLIGTNDGGCGAGNVDGTTGNCFDSVLSLTGLNVAGTYFLVLTEDDNIPLNDTYGAGFARTGQGNFTCATFGGSGPFCEMSSGIQRTGNYEVDVIDVASAADTTTPEPSSVVLFGSALTVLCLGIRRRLSSAKNV